MPEDPRHAILTKVSRPCHGQVVSLNLSATCAYRCVHCRHARPEGEPNMALTVDEDLPERLAEDLERRRRRSGLPRFVIVGSSTEPFPMSGQVQRISTACLEVLLSRKVGVSLETRGTLPDAALDLFVRHRGLVRVRVALLSMSAQTVSLWEPDTVDGDTRLFNLQRLRRAEVPAVLHLAPLVPFVNDTEEELSALLDAGKDVGARRVTAETLKLWPGAEAVLTHALKGSAAILLSAYMDRQMSPPTKRFTLPEETRQELYDKLRRLTARRGLTLGICSCADHELGSPPCSLGFGTTKRITRQLGLFGGADTEPAPQPRSRPSVTPQEPQRPPSTPPKKRKRTLFDL